MVDLNKIYQQDQTGGSSPVNLNDIYNQQSSGVSLNDLYNKSINPVDMNIIEQIESGGNPNAQSRKGARGIMQLMPATAANAGFGMKPINLDTSTPEQQKEFATEYMNKLVAYFHGDVDKAIAAYNDGAGNVDDAVNKYGKDWLNHLPKETQDYVNKYNDIYNTGTYDKAKYASRVEDVGNAVKQNYNQVASASDWIIQSANEIPTLWGGDVISPRLEAYEQADRAAHKAQVDNEAPVTLVGAIAGDAMQSAELLAGGAESEVAKGAGFVERVAKNLPTLFDQSIRTQLIDNGEVDPENTVIDVGFGVGMQGAGEYLLKPATKQILNVFEKLRSASEINPELETATRQYLAHSRLQELGEHLESLRELNPTATIRNALDSLYHQVPELFRGKQWEDLSSLFKDFDENISSKELLGFAKAGKSEWLDKAKRLANTDANSRLIKELADANDEYRKSYISTLRPMLINPDLVPDTAGQARQKMFSGFFGVSDIPIGKGIVKKNALRIIKPEADKLIKDLQGDTRRIHRELKSLEGKHGISDNKKRFALGRQKELNKRMINFLKSGLKGNALKVSDVAAAIKEVQEEQFNSGKFKGLTTRFKNLASKFKTLQVAKLDDEKDFVGDLISQFGGKKIAAGAASSLFGGIPMMGTLTALGTIAGHIAARTKSANVAEANRLAKLVESGDITEDEAVHIIERRMKKAAQASRLATLYADKKHQI